MIREENLHQIELQYFSLKLLSSAKKINNMAELKIGACSWKYDSWRGHVYSDNPNINYLEEYSKKYSTVEVDQWFWSLFDKIVLPDPKVVEGYKNSVPLQFSFTIKAPNSLTLTHYYNKKKAEPLKRNPHFLSVVLYEQFLEQIKLIVPQAASIIFQFEYLNKEKISSVKFFQNYIQKFVAEMPPNSPPFAIETRNPNYLSNDYFSTLNSLNLSHVFLEGYFMPPIVELYKKYKVFIKNFTIIRLHGPARSGIEKLSGRNCNKIYINRDPEIRKITDMIKGMLDNDISIYLNVNNHYEGCAPITIEKINNLI